MEITVKEILESNEYQVQRGIIQREVNWGALEYAVNQKVFKKTDNEKDRLKYLKRKWLSNMRKKFTDFTRKSAGKKKFSLSHKL